MSQSRLASLLESLADVGIGIVVSFAASFLIYPALGMPGSAWDYAWATAFFTVLSIARKYVVRRIGNRLQFR